MELREKTQLVKWNKIKTHLNQYFYKPDFISLRVALAQYACHFYLNDPPIWTFILGVSSSGKSAIINNGLIGLPYVHSISVIGENSFLSGFIGPNGKDCGMLNSLKEIDGIKNGIIVFNDFSTFLGLREETRKSIQGQLRDMFTGELSKKVGSKDKEIKWKGKVTILANCTPSLERHWSVGNDLGERFVYCRYLAPPVDDNLKMAVISQMHNNTSEIRRKYVELMTDYADYSAFESIELSTNYMHNTGLWDLCQLVELCRTTVIRDNYAMGKPIIDIEDTAIASRLYTSAVQIAKGSATMNGRKLPNSFDLKLSRKVMLDTMPLNRHRILKVFIKSMAENMDILDNKTLTSSLNIPQPTLLRELGNMAALDIISIAKKKFATDPSKMSLKSHFKEMIRNSRILENY